jgi:hypothetical protein
MNESEQKYYRLRLRYLTEEIESYLKDDPKDWESWEWREFFDKLEKYMKFVEYFLNEVQNEIK